MNRARTESDPPSGPTGSPLQRQTAATKPNRLRRSFRQTQPTAAAVELDSPGSRQSEFKTPTRIPRSRAGGGFSAESPQNDSDFQQDIVWDATSPSPSRLGKRGKKQPAAAVDISEIVSRIAPKHGRPKVAEPTLQQWIGDSATIPCTPRVQVAKPKKKSPRPNGVDDLLKLAKQFDFNMFRQDREEEEEEEEEDLHQQSLEVLSGDVLDFEDGDQSDFSPSLPGNRRPAVNAEAAMDEPAHLDQHVEDDLDFLFDGPTQHVSGNLSQAPSAQPSQVRPACSEASGKAPASTSAVSTTNTKGASTNDDFEDDWENDDLLNDSLVLEMTQNPQNFTSPKYCSTQKPPGDVKRQSPVPAPVSGAVGRHQSAVSKVEKDNVRQRTTFKLHFNPNLSVKRTQTDSWTNSKVDYSSKTAEQDTRQNRFSPGEDSSVEVGSERSWKTSNTVKSDPQKPQLHQRTSVSSVNHNTTTAQRLPPTPAVVPPHSDAPASPDLPDEDLHSFFSSDPVWDDPADDDLLCEMCEDVENQIQSGQTASTKWTVPVGHMSAQRAPLQPSNRTWDNGTHQPANRQPFPPKQTPTTTTLTCAPGRPAGTSLAAGSVSNIVPMQSATDSFRSTRAKNTSGPTNSWTCLQASGRVQAAPQGSARKDQFTFKKPNEPVTTVTNKAVVGKCSAAEIELKKQQAMERRRQRLQDAQNLRAPT